MFLNISKYHNKYINHRNITLCILYITIFTLPWNLFKVWRPEFAYINGHFVDYLAPKLYLNQLFVWLLWVWTLISTRGRASLRAHFPLKRGSLLAIALVGSILGWQMIRLQDISTIVWFFHLISGPILFGGWIITFSPLFDKTDVSRKILLAVILSTSWQALVGLTQYATQMSQTPYWFFGEPVFSAYKGLTLSNLNDVQRILPYGTTPHPNILAGWIIIGMLSQFIIWYINKYRHPLFVIFFFFQCLLLWLTESWTAWLSLPPLVWMMWLTQQKFWSQFGFSSFKKVVFITILLMQTLWLSLPVWLPAGESLFPLEKISISRRIHLEEVTLSSLRQHPWGMPLPEYFQVIFQSETSYIGGHFLQPVHHSGLFATIFLGYWIIILFSIITLYVQKYYSLIFLFLLAILPIFNLDHYLLSQIGGQYLLTLMLVYLYFLTNDK